ncbi:MAG TPA: DNA internalization-related competence protein ComEC/Rec2 [Candidatus Acidoferrum sp.]|nr:DNA internalization-related competence protein ComEC/Rec2 [Candidatus Acidoferrum sp.]
MKLPAVCLAAVFAGGAALGLFSPLARFAANPGAVRAVIVVAIFASCFSVFLLRKDRFAFAGSVSLSGWLCLGVAAAWIASQPPAEIQVSSLLTAGKIDIETPLRWHGHLRDEPAELPWGTSFDVALDDVEFDGSTLPARGGLRLSYAPHKDTDPLPKLHAGDAVAFLAKARIPQSFRDEGAFDRRAYLQQQGIDLTGTLRSAALIEKKRDASFSIRTLLARTRSTLRNELTGLFPSQPQIAGVLRAMLLGDRSFVDREESVSFQKTGVFHVLVVAGLHVGAFAVFLYWLGRKLAFSVGWTTLVLILALACYVAVIEQRPPVIRAALMAFVLLAGGYFFRRMELLNSAAIAALIILIAQPLELRDSSFQLSFLSIGCIAGIAVPWLGKTVEPFVRGLRGWRDVTRDASHPPTVTQFRIDLRSIASWLGTTTSAPAARVIGTGFVYFLRGVFRIWELVFLTLVLQIGMSPVMAFYFHRVTLLGSFANLAAVPLTGVLVPFGFLLLLIGLAIRSLALWITPVLAALTECLIHIVAWFSRVPHGSYRIPGPPAAIMVAFFLLLLILSIQLRTGWPRARLARGVTLVALLGTTILIATCPFTPKFARGKLELTVLDVGQGDSLLVVSPAGRTLLIDGGGQAPNYGAADSQRAPDPGEEAVSPYLWSRRIKTLDVVALTHAHQDHLGGLPAILDNFSVGALWIGRDVQTPALSTLESSARARGIPVLYESRGERFDWDGAVGEVLWPEQNSGETAASAKNNDSIVMRLHFHDHAFLLPGDAERQAESAILSETTAETLHADVLKVGHHGSKNSTTAEFLAAVHPQLAIISAGAENPYGHPSAELLQRLNDANIHILRTDQSGTIHVLTDGKTMEVTCFVSCGSGSTDLVGSKPENKNSDQHH